MTRPKFFALVTTFTVVMVCSVCQGTTFRRYGYHCDPGDPIATELAECLTCGQHYIYKCPPRPPTCEHVWRPDTPYCLKCKIPARQPEQP